MLRSLRILHDLVLTQNFTETARRNYLTQSAVSQHLKALEEKIGAQLIERGRGQVRLTRAGNIVFDAAKEILERYETMERALKKTPSGVSGRLRVGSIYTAGLYELPGYTRRFLKRYPNVNLLLTYLKDSEVYEALLADRIDIGVVDSPKPHTQIHITFFKNERIVLIASSKHPWAGRKRVSLAELHDQPFIVAQAEFPMDEILRKTSVRVKVVHAFDNIEITKRAVEVGLGMALVPLVTVANEVREGRLKILRLTEGRFDRPVGLLTRKGAELSLPALKFMELLSAPAEVR